MKLIVLIVYMILMSPVVASPTVIKTTIIYKYFDSKGVLHLTNTPPKSQKQVLYARSYLIPPIHSSTVPKLRKRHRQYNNYSPLIEAAAQNAKLPPALLHAVVQVESNYNPQAVSPKGAVGLMQLMPATAKRYGVTNRTDPVTNLNGGTRYLRDLLTLFDNDLSLALAAYNAGENAVKRYGNTIPPYRETKNYVKKVKKLYNHNLLLP